MHGNLSYHITCFIINVIYMKLILTACLLLGCYCTLQAQAGASLDVNEPGNSGGYGLVRFSNPSGSKDKVGDIDASDIKGNPYYNEKWAHATVVLINNKQVNIPQARLNLYNNELHYIDASGAEMVVDDRNVKQVYLADAKDTAKIIATFNVVQNYQGRQGGTYMQALNQGNIQLLKINAVQLVKKDYDPLAGRNSYAYQQNVSYVISNNGVLTASKLNETDIFTILTPGVQAHTWLTDNKNKLKNEKDVTSFLNWYNLNPVQ